MPNPWVSKKLVSRCGTVGHGDLLAVLDEAGVVQIGLATVFASGRKDFSSHIGHLFACSLMLGFPRACMLLHQLPF